MLRKSLSMTWVPWAWDPMTGCTPVSEGCASCIARSQRVTFCDGVREPAGFKPTLWPQEYTRPLEESQHRSMIVAPRSDFFHEAFATVVLHLLLDVMREAEQHTYYLLTKRPLRMHQVLTRYPHWPLARVNIGVSAENQRWLSARLPLLLRTPVHETAHRYLSCEPLLGPIFIGPRLRRLGAVIYGAERGNNKRPAEEEWLESIRLECEMVGVPSYHHNSGVLAREQRPAGEKEIRVRQCRARRLEGGDPVLLHTLQEIMAREEISSRELTRRIGFKGNSVRCRLFKGDFTAGMTRKVKTFLNDYNGGTYATS